MKDLKHPAKPLFRSESDVDVTIHSDEESNAESLDEDYHTNYGAFERSGTGLSFWLGEPLSPRAPSFRILVFFSGTATSRQFRTSGLVVTTEYYLDLLR